MKHLLNQSDTTKSKRLSSGECEGETKSKAERFIEWKHGSWRIFV